jgi:hypothetical protein
MLVGSSHNSPGGMFINASLASATTMAISLNLRNISVTEQHIDITSCERLASISSRHKHAYISLQVTHRITERNSQKIQEKPGKKENMMLRFSS